MGAYGALQDFFRSSKCVTINDPIGWLEKNVNFEHIKGNSDKGYVRLDPHQIKPFLALFDNKVRNVTIVAPPQVGKSFIWQAAIVVKSGHGAYRAWVAYENDQKAADVNTLSLTPLMKSVPKLKKQLDKPNSYKSDRYNLDETVIFFSGFQNEFATHSVMEFYGSETDRTNQTLTRRQAVFNTIRPRVSRFERKQKSKICIESSPDTVSNVSWLDFKRGSCDFWHVRCLSCDGLIPSHILSGVYKNGEWLGGLQFKRDENDEVIEDSIRLHCTHCNHPHVQNDMEKMNELGDYIAEKPHKENHISCQFGWLAGFRSRTFLGAAEEIMKVKNNDTYVQQLSLDNNTRGLPHQDRRKKNADNKTLEGHCVDELIDPKLISASFLVSDSQKASNPWVLVGVDERDNDHVLSHGIAQDLEDLTEDEWNRFYGDYKPTMSLIDEGGGTGRSEEVINAVLDDDTGCIFTYKGDGRRSHYEKNMDKEDEILFPSGKMFSISDTDSWRILADPKWYAVQLLHKLYSQENKGHSFLYFEPSEDCDDEFFKQILAQRPPKNAPDAPFEKWNDGRNGERVDDYFDCLKMFYVAKDYAKKHMDHGPDGWRKIMPWMD